MDSNGQVPCDSSIPCLRVAQLDAHDLDEYLVKLLIRQQLDKCMKHFFPNYIGKIKPELQTALYGLLLYFTVGKWHQSVGQKLFGVMLTDSDQLSPEPKKKIFRLVAFELFAYWWKSRYNDIPPAFIFSSPNLSKVLDIFIGVTKFLEIVNFLVFLRRGEFSCLFLRLLGLRLVFDHPNPVQSSISYALISREILWRELSECTLYFLNLLNLAQIKKYFQQMYRKIQEPVGDDLQICGVCEDWPSQPYETNCKHVFCYYCAVTAIAKKSKCPTCNTVLESLLGPKMLKINV